MDNYFGNNDQDNGGDDFWGSGFSNFWKWDQVGKTLTATVKERKITVFPKDEKQKPHPTLVVEDEKGMEWTVTISQVHLVSLMRAASVTKGTKFKATYVGDERGDKGVAKKFMLEILSQPGQAEAA